MARNHALGLLCLAPLFLTVAASAQGKTSPATLAPAQAGPEKISVDVVVTPKKGEPVSGLQQQDFKLLDNNVPVPITSFRAISGGQAPVEVVIVVDAVNVPYTSLSYMRGQVESFLRANDGQLAFRTSLAIFTDTGIQIQPGFTRDGNAEADSLNHASIGLRDLNRSSGFWGASERFQESVAALRQLTAREAARPGRKLIVWVSPGWALLSGPGVMLDQKQERGIFAGVVSLSTQLRQGGVTLYNVNPIGPSEGPARTFYYQQFLKGVSNPGQVDPADLSLQVLATQSGGLVLASSNDVKGELQTCYEDGQAYYKISFDAAHAERRDEYHSLDVQIARQGLTARTRKSYYAQP